MKTLAKSKIIGKIRQKTTQTATGNPGRGQKGSTIVAVMAALVFIGIVVAGMLKNTGSQSAASRGYGSAMDMSSTAASGIVATEGFFRNPNNGPKATEMIDSLVNKGSEKYVLGSATQKKTLSASSNQYFSSKLDGSCKNNLTATGGDVKAGFEIFAGKNLNGKKWLKKSRAFFQLEGFKQETPNKGSGAKNAIFATDKVNDGNAGISVQKGPATFMDAVKFQNAAAIFENNAYFAKKASFMKDSAYFKDTVYFASGTDLVEFHTKAIFDSMAVFNGPVQFENQAPATFKEKAYFMKGATFKTTVTFLKGVYFKEAPLFQGTATFKQRAYFVGGATFEAQAPATFDTTYFGGSPTFGSTATFNSITQIDGTATFNGDVTFGAKNSTGTFSIDDHWVYFGGDVVIEKASKFYSETFFAKALTLSQNNDMEFFHRVGFDGNINLRSKTIYSKKATVPGSDKFDVFIHGLFTNPGKVQSTIGNQNLNHSVFYSTAFQTAANVNGWINNALIGFDNKTHSPGIDASAFAKMTKIVKDKLKPAPTLPSIPHDSTRTDPKLAIERLYEKTTGNNGSVIIYDAKDVMTSDGSTFDITKLRNEYDKATKEKPSNTLYDNKFMVIEVTTSIGPPHSDPGIFDANIIYIIKENGGSLNFGSNFYSSSATSTASTLIYVGAGNAKLVEFGTRGDFRGFIYIDSANTSLNSIHFHVGGKIIGAIHSFSSKALTWNTSTGQAGQSIPVIFNTDVLNSFGTLYPPPPGSSTENGKVIMNADTIKIKQLGVYFY